MTREFQIRMTVAKQQLTLYVDGAPLIVAATTFTQEIGIAFGAVLFEHLAVATVNSEGSDAKPNGN